MRDFWSVLSFAIILYNCNMNISEPSLIIVSSNGQWSAQSKVCSRALSFDEIEIKQLTRNRVNDVLEEVCGGNEG